MKHKAYILSTHVLRTQCVHTYKYVEVELVYADREVGRETGGRGALEDKYVGLDESDLISGILVGERS